MKIKAKYGILKDRILIVDNFDKIMVLIEYLKQQTKVKNELTICETILGICGKIFLTDLINDIFERYYFEKVYNVCSFGNIDSIPAWWKSIKNIIDNEMHLIHEEKSKIEEQKLKDLKSKKRGGMIGK